MGSTVLGLWENFDAGHWGNKGPELATSNQFGGVNMIRTENGGVMPMSASRELPLGNATAGEVYGMFWAWGADGRVYYLQSVLGDNTPNVYRFEPDTRDQPITQDYVGTISGTATEMPDWAAVGTTVYMTVYGNKTYSINTTAGTMTTLTGSYGAAPAGRCIALYGERLVVGGISDSRFGTHPNRIVFSGDDTGNDPTDTTAWETLNYFDLGADQTPIVALLPARDHLIVILEDQQVYLITGVLGATAVARRIYGFHKGSGAVTAFAPNNAAVDPDQSRVWMFDHTQRTAANLNGAQFAKVNAFGAAHADRTASDILEGSMTMVGGPDEFVIYGVAASRSAGEGVVGNRLYLTRVNGAYALGQRSVIGLR